MTGGAGEVTVELRVLRVLRDSTHVIDRAGVSAYLPRSVLLAHGGRANADGPGLSFGPMRMPAWLAAEKGLTPGVGGSDQGRLF